MKRLLRSIVMVGINFLAITIFQTTSIPYLEMLAIKYLKITPYWDDELLEMVRWNRLVKKYGVNVAMEKFERKEFE